MGIGLVAVGKLLELFDEAFENGAGPGSGDSSNVPTLLSNAILRSSCFAISNLAFLVSDT